LFVPLPGRYHRLCIFLMDDAWYMSMKHQHGSGSFAGALLRCRYELMPRRRPIVESLQL
jgi:hypothetical protein